jgi:hypothetical protein
MGFLKRFRANPSGPASSQPPPADIYDKLRNGVLATVPGELGMAPTADAPRVWGVLLDMGMGNATATVVALADGTTSLYTSVGGGIIGGGEHERIATVAQTLIRVADTELAAFPLADSAPLPGQGRSALVILTYAAAQDVITELRLYQAAHEPTRTYRTD